MGLNKLDGSMIVSLIVAGIFSRLVPHPANMALVTGAAIFAGSRMDKTSGILVPLAIMFVSDLVIGTHSTMLFTWGSFALISLLANQVLFKKHTLPRLASVTIVSSILFFVISNFGVWLVGHIYPLTFSGLTTCFVNALPFFRNTIVGDVIYTGSIFGIYEGLKILLSRKSLAIS